MVSGESPLQQEEKLFGEGIDHWPKTPEPPTLRYYKNRVDQHFAISFSKEKSGEVWVRSVLALEPQGFPDSVYQMNLPESFFKGLVLEKAYGEERPDQPIKHVAVFVFRTKGRTNDLRLQFESRRNTVEKAGKYLRDFHVLLVSRI